MLKDPDCAVFMYPGASHGMPGAVDAHEFNVGYTKNRTRGHQAGCCESGVSHESSLHMVSALPLWMSLTLCLAFSGRKSRGREPIFMEHFCVPGTKLGALTYLCSFAPHVSPQADFLFIFTDSFIHFSTNIY